MRRIYALFVFCIFWMSPCVASEDDVRDNVAKLAKALEASQIIKIEFYSVSKFARFRYALDPVRLRRSPDKVVIIQGEELRRSTYRLHNALLVSKISPRASVSPSVCMGAVFYASGGQEVGALFLESDGRSGYINSKKVNIISKDLNRSLVGWFVSSGGWDELL